MGQREDIRELRAEMRKMRAQVQQRPIITKGGGGGEVPTADTLSGFDGNVLTSMFGTDLLGIKSGYDITEVPDDAPTASTTYEDGLGYAYLNGGPDLVWVAVTALSISEVNVSLPYGWVTRSLSHVLVPVTGSSPERRTKVYLPWVP